MIGTQKNKYILDFLKRAVESGRLAHGYLFWGPAKTGKKDTAFWLADFLKTNPFDILYIIPEEDKKDISINQIRKVKKHLCLSSYNSVYKFVIIDKAETMNSGAANALLKTLEEPQGNAILILITSKPDVLPDTILSRLQDIRFRLIPLNEIAKDILNKEYIDILQKPLNDIFKYIETITKEKVEIMPLLDAWLFWYRKKMINNSKYMRYVKEIQEKRDLISSTNINKRLVLENLVLCIKN